MLHRLCTTPALRNLTRATTVTHITRPFSLLKTTITKQELYDAESTRVLKTIEDRVLADDIDLEFDNDISSNDDVLSIGTSKGTWVLNKHNVTKQIWVSSPMSGPSKYNYHIPEGTNEHTDSLDKLAGGKWLNERDDIGSLYTLLTTEFSQVFNMDIEFEEKF